MPFYPVFLNVRGASCVVVGGGSVAARKVRALVEAGALVTVVSPHLCDELEAMAAGGRVEVHRNSFEPKALEGARLAVAATDDPAVNEAVSREAQAAGIPVNVVDQPALSTFIVPATVSRGRLQVAISTSGASPAFAKRLRERLEGLISPRLAAYVDAMAEARAVVLEQVDDGARRARVFEALAADEVIAQCLDAEPDQVQTMLLERARELIARAGVEPREGGGPDAARIIVLGVTHKTAPVELRERLAIGRDELRDTLRLACQHANVAECVALSTCNRVELYAAVVPPLPWCFLKSVVTKSELVRRTELEGRWLELDQSAGIHHLFEVVSGLDAMVVGEPEIVAQVKQAYRAAETAGTLGPVLGELFRKALSVSKRVRTETDVGQGAPSVAAAAVHLARTTFGGLARTRVLIVGAGDTGETTLRHLVKHGARAVVATNRSFERAEALARRFDGRAVPFDRWLDELTRADIVITATASPEPILTATALRAAMRQRRDRPIFVIDIAVPRDVEPAARGLDGVHLVNIDDLKSLVHEHLATRTLALERARAIVDEETRGYGQWLERRDIEPTIKQLYEYFETVRARELDEHLGRLRGLTPELRMQFERLSKHLVKQLLHGPVSTLRSVTDQTALARHTEALDGLFGAGGEAPRADEGVGHQEEAGE